MLHKYDVTILIVKRSHETCICKARVYQRRRIKLESVEYQGDECVQTDQWRQPLIVDGEENEHVQTFCYLGASILLLSHGYRCVVS